MRVLHVNDYPEGGGAEQIARQTVAGLNERGVDASLWTSADVPGHRRSAISYVANRRARGALARQLSQQRPDVVHLHNFYHELSPSILLALARWKQEAPAKRRLVMTAHDYHLLCPNSGLRMKSRREGMKPAGPDDYRQVLAVISRKWDDRSIGHGLLKTLQHLWHYRVHNRRAFIDLVICPCPFMARTLAPIGLATIVIPNPIAPFDPPTDVVRPTDRLRIAYAGRVEPEKGLSQWIANIPRDFTAELAIIGEGTDLSAARDAAARLPNVSLDAPGRLSRAETIRRIASAHVLVLPSRWPENDPLVLIEALACRTNIIVSRLGGPADLVSAGGVGFAFDPFDRASTSAALLSVQLAFERGDLNLFDPGPMLGVRLPDRYFERLLRAYDPASPAKPAPLNPREASSSGAAPCASC